MVATFEFISGLMLILGLGTRVGSILIVGIMVVAIKTAKMGDVDGVVSLFGLSEFQFIVVALILLCFGPGKASLEPVMKRFCPKC